MGITLARLSMLCAVWNDLVFKTVRSGSPLRSGRFVAGIGVIWTLVLALPLVFNGQPAQWQGWFYALMAGGASAAANILLIDCLARVDVGVGSTVYRLNLIWVLLSGVLVCGIVFFLSRALACTEASVAVPISQFNFVGTAVLGIVLFNEPLTLRKGAGLAAAGAAVVLLAVG